MAYTQTLDSSHHVQFYEDSTFLAVRVASFLADALDNDGAAAAVARSVHLSAIERQLRLAGLDVDALVRRGVLLLAEAEPMLDKFLVGGMPDEHLFRAHVGTPLAELMATAPAPHLHVYGEMVDVLWASGRPQAVLRLEQLWTELITGKPISLLCGYRMAAFAGAGDGFDTICANHDPMMPEQIAVVGARFATTRAVAELEQRARTLEGEVRLRRRLEDRMHQLLAITGELAAARTRDEAVQLIVDAGARAVGASTATLWLLASNRLEVVAASDAAGRAQRAIDLAGDSPLALAVRTGDAMFVGSRGELAARFPGWTSADVACAIVPVVGDAAPIGVVCFAYDHVRSFDEPDRAFKVILGRQCALALTRIALQEHERALREAAERQRADSDLLYELTASLNRVDDLDDIYALAVGAILRGSHSDRAAILMFDDAGVMRFRASDGLSETYRNAVEGHSPWRSDETAPAPVIVDDAEHDPAWAAYRDVFRAEGIRALAFVPVAHHRKLLGKFMLYRNEPRPFAASEILLTSTIAVHLAHAVARVDADRELARLYREERDAHLEAEQATRAREEILSVVSHDLRNPLNAIMMGATALLGPDRPQRGHPIAERIHRQAARMARLIEDLVDFAGIEAGRLALRRAPHAPEQIVAAVSDLFAPLAEAQGLRFSVEVPRLPAIDCDSERVVQVLSNLVSNALKVTPRGGAISVGVRPDLVFYVRDTGPGIAPEELPNLFERYWRSKTADYKGTGLGLSIARGIVAAHGGEIWAESEPGAGTTFLFSLDHSRR